MGNIPYGYCHCGCGEKTNLAQNTCTRSGWVKGQPIKYIVGHVRRRSPVEYVEEDRGYVTPCWIWQRAFFEQGYGLVGGGANTGRAHRKYYEKKYGHIPDGLEIDHRCRVRACVNPDHLEPVTHKENTRRGAKTRLSQQEVATIRTLYATTDYSVRDLAPMFGISKTHVWQIVAKKRWLD